MVETIESISKPNSIWDGKAQSCVIEDDSLLRRWNLHRSLQIDLISIGRDSFNMSDRWGRAIFDSPRIDYGDAAIQGKPDVPLLVCDNRPVPSHALVSVQTVRKIVLMNIIFSKRTMQELVSVHSKYMIRCCDPQ